MNTCHSFDCFEQAIDRVQDRFPGTPRQQILLTRLFFHLLPRMSNFFNETLHGVAMNETLWMALMAMYASPEKTLNPSDISDTLGSSRTNATRIADELVKNGWAERQMCPADRRKIILSLTPQGEEVVRAVLPDMRQRHVEMWQDFAPEELEMLETMMRKLLSRMGG